MRHARLAAVLAAVVMLVVAQRLGLLHELSEPARLARDLAGMGPKGYVAFVAAYAVLQPFGLSGMAFVAVASLIWPWPVAFALSMTGSMAASIVGFSFVRLVARERARAMIPARFRRYDEALARRGLVTVIGLRSALWTSPVLHAFFGVCGVPFWTHFWGSLIAYAVPVFVVSYFGQRVLDALRAVPPWGWLAAGTVASAVAIAVWAVRRRRAATVRCLLPQTCASPPSTNSSAPFT